MDGLNELKTALDTDSYITVKLGRRNVKALIDTGAHNSCVSKQLVNLLNLQNRIVPSRRRLFSASGRPMLVVGILQLTLDIHNLMIPVTFCVVNYLMHDMILGMDFLSQTNAKIDIPSRVLT